MEPRRSFWRELLGAGGILGLAGLIFQVLGVELSQNQSTTLYQWFTQYAITLGMLLCMAIGGFGLGWVLFKKKFEAVKNDAAENAVQIEFLSQQLSEEKIVSQNLRDSLSGSIPYTRIDRGRWNKFRSLKYGHIVYAPLLHSDAWGKPAGLGVKLIEQLLRIEVEGQKLTLTPHPTPSNWSEIVEGLVRHDYDIVATPLFATAERSRKISFSMPIFFSNIGLFASKEFARSFPDGRTQEELLGDVLNAPKLTFLTIDEEISDKLAIKYNAQLVESGHEAQSIEKSPARSMIDTLFDMVADDPHGRKLFFCESVHSEMNSHAKCGDVVNILKPHEILYPVCFAIRHGDYQLANLLNIRLLELAEHGGALRILADSLSASEDIDVARIERHFVAQWPCRHEVVDVVPDVKIG